MRAPKTSSTSSSRWAAAAAIATVLGANLWVGVRLPALLQESSIDDVLELERRIEVLPDKAHVAVLLLGNSHAIDGLRPALLATGLGVAPAAVFNMAMAGASPGEMQLMLERHLGRFPGVKRVVCAVDATFLGAGSGYRTRYLTRFSPIERWRFVNRGPGALDDRLGAMAALPFPAADFNGPLRDALGADAGLAARRLFRDELKPGSHQALTAAMRYPWGLPPERSRTFRRLVNMPDGPPPPAAMRKAAQNTAAYAAGSEAGLAELQALADFLARRGLAAEYVESPANADFMAIVDQVGRDRYAAYVARLTAFFAAGGRSLTRSPGPWPARYFYDQEHMTAAGAAAFAAWLRAAGKGPATAKVKEARTEAGRANAGSQ